jgi:AcrR family transcriptional regulator
MITAGARVAGVRQFDEDAVLTRALDLFWRQGFAATSMPELAAATGVQRGSLYHAYGDKQALFLLAFERYAERFLDSAKSALTQPDPRAAIGAFLDVAIANMTDGSPARGCLTTRTALEADSIDNNVADRLRSLLDQLETLVTNALKDRASSPALKIAPDAAADLVVTFTRGLAVMERVYRDESRLRRTAATLVELLFYDTARRVARKN